MKIPFAAAALVLGTAVGLSGCGRQGPTLEELTGGSGIAHVDEASFAAAVEQAKGVVVVDFWASWCGPCHALAPRLEKLAGEYAGRVKIYKVNVDENKKLAQRYKVQSIPLLVLFKDGEAQDLSVGLVSERALRDWFDKHLM